MLIGYARVSKADGSQALDLQRDAFMAAGVGPDRIYEERAAARKKTARAWRRDCAPCETAMCSSSRSWPAWAVSSLAHFELLPT